MKYLKDPWQRQSIALVGFAERHEFAPWLMALLMLLVALVSFQLIIAPLTIIALLLMRGVGAQGLVDALISVMEGDAELMLIANTVGQFLGLALPVLVFARLSSPSIFRFLRVTRVSPLILIFSVVGLAALIPIVDVAAQLNRALPWPESIREFETLMQEPLRKYLSDRVNLIPGILMIAATPAICEEVLFRGYVLRQAERSMGSRWGIVFAGVIFGVFHLLPTQVLPLSLLGLFMAYLTWRTGSVWPAVLVHFANNTFAVVMTILFSEENRTPDELEQLDLPIYFVIAGIIVFACSIYLIESLARAKLAERQQYEGPVHEGEVSNED
ncbi:MAG: CPBP family intramembrane metalloprotease [Rhodothermales bacterium]|nr:CPBP family intramembrane metalloprotease [Rhodothermales bacterium]